MNSNEVSFDTRRVAISGYQHTIILHNGDFNTGNNNNGSISSSCALVALCNALLLSPGMVSIARNLIQLVANRQTVTKGELVQILSSIGVQQNNTIDINQLFQILPNLCDHEHDHHVLDKEQNNQNKLSVNPAFNGSFEDGMEMSIFRLYNVGLVHGWIIDPENDSLVYEHVSKYTYENAQRALVQSYDIKRNSIQTTDSQQIVEDANYLKSFLARSATQLTDYGLKHLKEIMVEKSFAVLYRNDEFLTLYKNNGELFTLIVDPKYSDSNDIVWKSLKSVNGTQDSLYTGAFIPVGMGRSNTEATSFSVPAESPISNPFEDNHENTQRNSYNKDKTVEGYKRPSNPPPGHNVSNTHDDNTNTNSNTSPRDQVQEDEEMARILQEQEDEEYAAAVRQSYMNGDHQQKRQDRTKSSKSPQKKTKKKLFSRNKKKKDSSSSSDGKKDGKSCIVM